MTTISLEECELLGDSKYRAYISQVEKALKNFEYTSEWADLISALGKLNKVLLNHVKYAVIPKRVTIGKRLAQCLHPALPSGVHLKALETYDIIFKCIGTQRLAANLFTYGSGLFPLLSYAAMSVKPALLSIYENHFIPLGRHCKPALTGLLIGLLPGLEEGSENFDRTTALLEEFCDAAEPTFFYGCLWECVLANPSIRLSAMTFVLAHYNRKMTMEDQLQVMGTNIDLLVQALCAAVQDSSVLVQRSTLDFLLLGFPLHNSQLTRPDLSKVITDAVKVVLRRDMSLNRRLYAWLLGTDANGQPIHQTLSDSKTVSLHHCDSVSTTSESDMYYFNMFAKEPLVFAIKNCIHEGTVGEAAGSRSANLKPFRILISLLDKPEIGSVIVEDVLMDILRCMYHLCIQPEENQNEAKTNRKTRRKGRNGRAHTERLTNTEVIKTANMLFGSFEPFFIWDYIARMFELSCAHSGQKGDRVREIIGVAELCHIVDFLLEKISLETYPETQTVHLPELLRQVTSALTAYCDTLSESEFATGLRLSSNILARVLPSMVPVNKDEEVSLVGIETQSVVVENNLENAAQEKITSSLDDNNVKEVRVRMKVIEPADESEASIVEKDPTSAGSTDTSGPDLVETAEEAFEEEEQNSNVNKTEPDFSEFVQFEAELNDCASPRIKISPFKSPKRKEIDLPPQTLMQACLHAYQNLFVVLVTKKMLFQPETHQPLLSQLLLSQPSPCSSVTTSGDLESPDCMGSWSRSWGTQVRKLPMQYISPGLREAFCVACQLLVDFSCFPMYCTDQTQVVTATSNREVSDLSGWPEWLQLLLLCVCFVDNFPVQSAAISAMLDLISLTKSVAPPAPLDDQSWPSGGTVSVVIVPALPHKHLEFLNEHTRLYQVVTRQLWDYLGDMTPAYHSRSAELLHQLHQLAPTPWVCEDVIGETLVSDDMHTKIQAHKKFTTFWHILRGMKRSPTPGSQSHNFDRSMFVVLDSLQSETHECRALTQTWLTHSVQRGDIARILEPILLQLLHPDTARISIQHVNIHQPKKIRLNETSDDATNAEAKIYAISSEGGNVIYHVSNKGANKHTSRRPDLVRQSSYAMAAVTDNGSSTKMAKVKGDTELSFDRVNPTDLKLRINPFGSEGSIDRLELGEANTATNLAEIQRAKRLDSTTCKKEGIVFGDSNNNDEDEDESTALLEEDTAEQIVRSILDQMLSQIGVCDPEIVLEGLNEVPQMNRLRLSSSHSRDSLTLGPDDLLNAIDSKVSEGDSQSEASVELTNGVKDGNPSESQVVHPLHTHILLYTQKYDSQRTLHALGCLKSILTTSPRLVVCAMATTNLSSAQTPLLPKIQNLLARHRRSVFGKNFFSEVPHDALSSYRTSMYIEIFLSLLLYLIRSYYPNLMVSKLTEQELNVNKEVQILSAEILTQLLTEIINVARDSGRGFATYISDLLSRCKVQKVLLHCILASVYNSRHKTPNGEETNITEAIISFNEESMDANTNETFQIKLLRLLLVVIILEDQLNVAKSDALDASGNAESWENSRVQFQPSLTSVRYLQGRPMVYQAMLLSAILSALKQQHLAHMHRHWVATVTSSLPYMGRAMSQVVVAVVTQLCKNLETCSHIYEKADKMIRTGLQTPPNPPDHVIVLLEGLTTICHYCLLDNGQQLAIGQPLPAGLGSIFTETAGAIHIFSNLVHVFTPYGNSREPSPQKEVSNTYSPLVETRRNLLSHLPRILASLSQVWRAAHMSEQQRETGSQEPACWVMGTPKTIRHYILEFISPISLLHGINLMGSLAVVWNDRRGKGGSSQKRVIPLANDDQLLLVDIVSSIKVLPMDTLIQTVKEVISHPPPTSSDKNKKKTLLEVSMLQLFFAYVQKMDGQYLVDSWPTLLSLLKEGLGLSLPPPGQFLLLAILNEFVQKIPLFEERKEQKELQEITQKLLEACSEIAGSSLEQTTWLRRNLAVKPGPQMDLLEGDQEEAVAEQEDLPSPQKTEAHRATDGNYRQYSVQALVLLADLIAPLLDVVYRSEEKDKVVPLLYSVMSHVFPYLKNHSTHNLPSYRACSQILASLSEYQYTRKAWRREAFDLVLDAVFFQTDEVSIRFWHTIVDNLMTQDKTTFKDLLARVVITQGNSLNLFSSKEQEFEQRAQLLKRLSYTIFCSETDQYHKSMPEIQERLADSLRLPQVPSLQAQVFLFFRVLVLRISPQHLTSLWPTIITELVHVLLQVEQELCPDAEESKNQKKHSAKGAREKSPDFTGHPLVEQTYRTQLARMANLDSSWAQGNGLNAHGNPVWLQLYLAACKLMDLSLVLAADDLPQFQLYRWAFVGDPGTEEGRRRMEQPLFIPHVIRISRLMSKRYKKEPNVLVQPPGYLRLTVSYIHSLQDLHSFFHTLALSIQSPESVTFTGNRSKSKVHIQKSRSAHELGHAVHAGNRIDQSEYGPSRQLIEDYVEADFLENIPST